MSVLGLGAMNPVAGYISQKTAVEKAGEGESALAGQTANTAPRQTAPEKVTTHPVTVSAARHLPADIMSALQHEQEVDQGASSTRSQTTVQESTIQSEQINGFEVIVSGHSIDAREGISLLRTVGGQLSYSPELLAQIEADKDNPQQHFTLNVSAPIEALPPGATGSYMPISTFKLEGQWNRGNPIELSTEMADQYNREDTEAFLERLEAERQLKDKYGEEIKLVYSHADNGYIMLTPDDLHYDEIPSVQEQMDGMLSEIRQGYNYSEATLSVLREHHYNV